jgi:predicted nucleic acid-binding protein
VILYAESSAVLAWLLGSSKGDKVASLLNESNLVIVSDLVLVECSRVLHRLVALRELDETTSANFRADLKSLVTKWQVVYITPEIAERAKGPFPAEPVRALDAIHLASALAARVVAPDVQLLSLDDRVRRIGRQLGFGLQPN